MMEYIIANKYTYCYKKIFDHVDYVTRDFLIEMNVDIIHIVFLKSL